jgi:signal peptidase II
VSNGAASAARDARAGRPGVRRIAPVIVGSVVLADQLTKAWVVANHSDSPLSIVGTTVEFRVARNSGGAFSTFTNATIVLAVLAIGLTIWLVRTLRRTTDLPTVVALSLVLGGAIGNLCDRIFRSPGVLQGHVVDFVKVGSFPSFNVADSAITIGAILLIVLSFRKPAPEQEPGAEPVA